MKRFHLQIILIIALSSLVNISFAQEEYEYKDETIFISYVNL